MCKAPTLKRLLHFHKFTFFIEESKLTVAGGQSIRPSCPCGKIQFDGRCTQIRAKMMFLHTGCPVLQI
jgi:hypothetical protein